MTSTVAPTGNSPPSRYARADHSSPPICTRPPPAAPIARVTTALRPMSASVPVRESAGRRTWRRAIGRRNPSESSAATMNTISEPAAPAPSTAATAAAPAESASGPRKNIPGVSSSPIARTIAATTHTTQPTDMTLDQIQDCAEVGKRLALGVQALAVEEHRLHSGGARSLDVVLERIADHQRGRRRDVEQLEDPAEDRLVRLRLAVVTRSEHSVDCEAVMTTELVQAAGRVREQPQLERARP